MQFIDIKNGYATITLSPPLCASLARACYTACEHTFDSDIDLWHLYAAFFD